MQLHLVPIEQLLEILSCVKLEIKRRRKSSKEDAASVRTFQERYPDKNYYKPVNGEEGSLQSLPIGSLKSIPQRKLRYLMPLLKQDWDYLFPNKSESKKYYVYAHVDTKNKNIALPKECGGTIPMPFYIGKGTGNRAYDLKRNQGHGSKLRQLIKRNKTPKQIVHILKDGLSESVALALESKLIYFFGTIYNHKTGVLTNLELPDKPNFKSEMRLPPSPKMIADKAKKKAKKEAKMLVIVQRGRDEMV